MDQQEREHPRRRKRESPCKRERKEFLTDNLLVRMNFIIQMIWWTGLAPWEFEGSLISTLLEEWRHEEWRHEELTSRSESIPDAASTSPPANARPLFNSVVKIL